MARTPDGHAFTVTGSGNFPTDMLRYDRCWPRTELDSVKVGIRSLKAAGEREIRLTSASAKPPTAGRWKSFGWTIVGDVRPLFNVR